MTGIVLVVAVGVFVASLVAFAITVVVPGGDTTNTEDRLAQMASRRRGRGNPEEGESGSLLLTGELDDQTSALGRLLSNMPALADYLEQADVQMQPAKFAFICIAALNARYTTTGKGGGLFIDIIDASLFSTRAGIPSKLLPYNVSLSVVEGLDMISFICCANGDSIVVAKRE